LQLIDLFDAEKDLLARRSEIEQQIDALDTERTGILSLLDNKLKPKAALLKQSLIKYKKLSKYKVRLGLSVGLNSV
jgi:predicted phage-related endonuclease